MKDFRSKMEVERVDLEAIVASQYPEYKKVLGKNHKFRCKCPHCAEGKSPALSILGNLKVGICFRCEILFVNDETRAKLTTNDILESLELFKDDKNSQLTELSKEIFDLFDKVENNEFLNKRNPYVKDWNIYGIKQGDKEVITPYYIFGKLVYYQIRRYDPRGFHNPKNIEAPLFLPRGEWRSDEPTIIVEGPFDAIAMDCVRTYSGRYFNIAALGGKVMTAYRLNLLKLLGTQLILVCLDETELSQKLKDSIYSEFERIKVLRADGRDPEEMLRDFGIQQYSEYVIRNLDELVESRWNDRFRLSKTNEKLLSDTIKIKFD